MKRALYSFIAAVTLTALAGCKPVTEDPSQEAAYTVNNYPRLNKVYNPSKKSLVFILDTSSSMNESLNGNSKIDQAKRSLKDILEVYRAHNDKNDDLEAALYCFSDNPLIKELMPLKKFDYHALNNEVDKAQISYFSGTPLGMALARAERELDFFATGNKYIILLTDGENSIGRDPEKVFADIQQSNPKSGDRETTLYVIAFNVDRKVFDPLEKLGAKVREAQNGKELTDVLQAASEEILLEAPDPKAK